MKTLIKVIKRETIDAKNTNIAAQDAKPKLTTEMIVKSWIIESRDRRRSTMTKLRDSIQWERERRECA